jgi:hypothetical protein
MKGTDEELLDAAFEELAGIPINEIDAVFMEVTGGNIGVKDLTLEQIHQLWNICQYESQKRAPPRRKHQRRCANCGHWVGYDCPVLRDEIWLSIAKEDDVLHFKCAEERLGRHITVDDLEHVPFNLEWLTGLRGANR